VSSGTPPLRAGTPVRTLPNVLRRAIDDRQAVRLQLGKVTATPDLRHVTVDVSGATRTIPKLRGYTPVVGEPCYILTGQYWTLALGTVSATALELDTLRARLDELAGDTPLTVQVLRDLLTPE
jgi:hypothetical protein